MTKPSTTFIEFEERQPKYAAWQYWMMSASRPRWIQLVYKFFRSIGRAYRVFKILYFGKYQNSGWDGERDYHSYLYKNRVYNFDVSGTKPNA